MKTFTVYGNPWLQLDHMGRPAHACPCDTEHTGGHRRWVGASIDIEKTKVTNPDRGYQDHQQDTHRKFVDGPQTIPESHYYGERLRHGELIPACKASMLAAGIKGELDKHDPLKMLAESRAKAFDEYTRDFGEAPPFERVAQLAKAKGEQKQEPKPALVSIEPHVDLSDEALEEATKPESATGAGEV